MFAVRRHRPRTQTRSAAITPPAAPRALAGKAKGLRYSSDFFAALISNIAGVCNIASRVRLLSLLAGNEAYPVSVRLRKAEKRRIGRAFEKNEGPMLREGRREETKFSRADNGQRLRDLILSCAACSPRLGAITRQSARMGPVLLAFASRSSTATLANEGGGKTR